MEKRSPLVAPPQVPSHIVMDLQFGVLQAEDPTEHEEAWITSDARSQATGRMLPTGWVPTR